MKYDKIVKGVFIERPNRFIAKVLVDGKTETCHVLNIGRCKELLIKGVTVYLNESSNINRKTKYDVVKVIKEDKYMMTLIKPQFETSKKEHNKNGVVNNPKLHFQVIKNVMESANKFGLHLNKLDFSPIKGDKSGNIEYLGLFSFNKVDVSN